jgi:hypothetical protein
MALIDHLPTVNLRPPLRAVAPQSEADLADADELIADLAALVDAGLVTVRRQLGGPVRYGAVVDLGDAA